MGRGDCSAAQTVSNRRFGGHKTVVECDLVGGRFRIRHESGRGADKRISVQEELFDPAQLKAFLNERPSSRRRILQGRHGLQLAVAIRHRYGGQEVYGLTLGEPAAFGDDRRVILGAVLSEDELQALRNG